MTDQLVALAREAEQLTKENIELRHKLKSAERELAAVRQQLSQREQAIRWALGEIDDFPTRQLGRGAYWWRTELRKRAELPSAPGPSEQEER